MSHRILRQNWAIRTTSDKRRPGSGSCDLGHNTGKPLLDRKIHDLIPNVRRGSWWRPRGLLLAKRSPTNVITETFTRPIPRFIEIPSHILSRGPPDKLRARPQGNIRLLAIPVNGMDLAALITGRTRHFLAFLVALRGPTLRPVQLPLDSTGGRFRKARRLILALFLDIG